jgi:hypothetical protein
MGEVGGSDPTRAGNIAHVVYMRYGVSGSSIVTHYPGTLGTETFQVWFSVSQDIRKPEGGGGGAAPSKLAFSRRGSFLCRVSRRYAVKPICFAQKTQKVESY